jgi:CRP-like cAMP-binding protein
MKLYLTREILEECLQSLDIFRELLDDPIQHRKLLRDVNKNLQLKLYDEGATVYARGEVAESLYLVIRGHVSLIMPAEAGEEQEIDVFGEGMGFG